MLRAKEIMLFFVLLGIWRKCDDEDSENEAKTLNFPLKLN